jgi:hypothetical protein
MALRLHWRQALGRRVDVTDEEERDRAANNRIWRKRWNKEVVDARREEGAEWTTRSPAVVRQDQDMVAREWGIERVESGREWNNGCDGILFLHIWASGYSV